jgi:hypothetical protein
MSVAAMSWVFDLKGEGAPTLGTRLVLLALADNAGPRGDDEQMVAWPSVRTLARKACLSERATQYALRSLRDAELISEVGKSPAGTVIYALSMGVQNLHRGAESAPGGVKLAAPEPSLEPSSRDISIEISPSSASTEPSRPTSKPEESNVKSVPAGSCMSNDISRATVLSLFSYWRTQCGHPTAKLKRDRERKIVARLREGYTEADIRRAIDGAAKHAFVNENGVRFDDLELICRSSAKLEGFIERASPSAAGAQQATVAELMAAYERPRARTGV